MLAPKLNKFYQEAETQVIFEVIDLKEDYINIQYTNGIISEYSLEEWERLDLIPMGSNEHWSMSWEINEEEKDPYHSDHSLNRKNQDTIAHDDDTFNLESELDDGYIDIEDL
jgi:hypothetical protein